MTTETAGQASAAAALAGTINAPLKRKAPKAKKPAKKATKKTAAKKTERTPRDPNALGKVQLRILKALSKAVKPLTGQQLADKAEVDPSMIGNQAGYRDPEINARPVHQYNLLNRKLVRLEQHEGEPAVYSITAAGRSALEKASK